MPKSQILPTPMFALGFDFKTIGHQVRKKIGQMEKILLCLVRFQLHAHIIFNEKISQFFLRVRPPFEGWSGKLRQTFCFILYINFVMPNLFTLI